MAAGYNRGVQWTISEHAARPGLEADGAEAAEGPLWVSASNGKLRSRLASALQEWNRVVLPLWSDWSSNMKRSSLRSQLQGAADWRSNRTFSPLDATRSYKLGLIKGGRGIFARSSTKTD